MGGVGGVGVGAGVVRSALRQSCALSPFPQLLRRVCAQRRASVGSGVRVTSEDAEGDGSPAVSHPVFKPVLFASVHCRQQLSGIENPGPQGPAPSPAPPPVSWTWLSRVSSPAPCVPVVAEVRALQGGRDLVPVPEPQVLTPQPQEDSPGFSRGEATVPRGTTFSRNIGGEVLTPPRSALSLNTWRREGVRVLLRVDAELGCLARGPPPRGCRLAGQLLPIPGVEFGLSGRAPPSG